MKKPMPHKGTAKAMPGKVAPAPPARSAGVPEGERKYRAEDAVRTLTRAAEIKADPKLMADVKAHAAHQAHHLKKIARGGPK